MADARTDAYQRGLAGRPMTEAQKRAAEQDDSILSSWQEGWSDRGATAATTSEPPAPEPKATTPSPRRAPSGSPRAPRYPRGGTTRKRPTWTNPTQGWLTARDNGGGFGAAVLGAVFYALVLSVVKYGTKGPGYWFSAKFLNKVTVPGSTTSAASGPGTSVA